VTFFAAQRLSVFFFCNPFRLRPLFLITQLGENRVDLSDICRFLPQGFAASKERLSVDFFLLPREFDFLVVPFGG